MRVAAIVLLNLILAADAGAAAVPGTDGGALEVTNYGGTDAYCKYVDAVAKSASDILLSPDIVTSEGLLRTTSSQTLNEATLLVPRLRIAVGLQYSVSKLRQGLLLRDQARAQCDLYRAITELNAFSDANTLGMFRRSLQTKIEIYEKALPHAFDILSELRALMQQSRATIDEVNATQLRIEMMHSAISEAREQMAMLPEEAPNRSLSLIDLIKRHAQAEEQIEGVEASLRGVQGWDIAVDAGYEKIWHLNERVPVYAEMTFTFNFGMFFKPKADERALEARKLWISSQANGADERVNQTLRKLRALLEAQKTSLKDATALRAEIEERLKQVVHMDIDRARRFTDDLWFELVRVVANQEFLKYTDRRTGDYSRRCSPGVRQPTAGRFRPPLTFSAKSYRLLAFAYHARSPGSDNSVQLFKGGAMNIVERVKNIIITPKSEWQVIAGEEPDIKQIFMGYVLPLVLIPTIASVIGFGLIGRMGFRVPELGNLDGDHTVRDGLGGDLHRGLRRGFLSPQLWFRKEPRAVGSIDRLFLHSRLGGRYSLSASISWHIGNACVPLWILYFIPRSSGIEEDPPR